MTSRKQPLTPSVAAAFCMPVVAVAQSGAATGSSSWFPLLMLVLITAAFIGVLRVARAAWRGHQGLPTFEECLAVHPHCRERGGQVLCHVCGHSGIHLRWLNGGYLDSNGPKAHVCRHCGTPLWRSGGGS